MQTMIQAAAALRGEVDAMTFQANLSAVYNPLDYAWAMHQAYIERYGRGEKRVLFLGMNPGPHGMVQTGIPFGDPEAVRTFLKLDEAIAPPAHAHPKLPVEGLAHRRGEVSGRRLWGLFQKRFGTAEAFFAEHFVLNYCPLAFFTEGKRGPVNYTPDKLPAAQTHALYAACDRHLRAVVALTKVEWVIGVGGFARNKAQEALGDGNVKIGTIAHPSPASPLANRGDWGELATSQLRACGVWQS